MAALKTPALVLALIVLSSVAGVNLHVPTVNACNTCDFLLSWGSYGSGSGQFSLPWGVAVDPAGNVYVTDSGNFRLQNERVEKFTNTGTFITSWGSLGSGDGQFENARGIAVDPAGNVYVVDQGGNRIEKFSSTGTFITSWGSLGSGDGQFYGPDEVAVDSSSNVYVTDFYNFRVEKFTSTGTFITSWGSHGSGDGQFNFPFGVAVDGSGNVYVADTSNYRVEKFGEAVTASTTSSQSEVLTVTSNTAVPEYGSYAVVLVAALLVAALATKRRKLIASS
jgi:DNA-binding beta-propeller fold protein YncE